ncbi:peptide chain release factor N(5)-glutamine methyltransferase [Acutalibacter caecimuris]|uniref:peptide chain release factor N(5)-glutamine methyltransferase n=1 Tax=Acutalibacter caecimuris TaxID=3093657 RepID=UPI002AC98B57|nr:peptide chain release factor N(5)-glutamine methyltransferase [Acutalibacter sp. M00118]
MTYQALYREARARLAEAGIDSPGFDASVLAEKFLGAGWPALSLKGEEPVPAPAEGAFRQAVAQRAARRPLQYIVGEWPFMSLTLAVGEGVLIPREDTAVVVEALAAQLADVRAPQGLDLCSGTGAAGLGLCSLVPAAGACVEVSDMALGYLRKNLARYPQYALKAVQADVLAPETPALFAGGLDFLLANPPYIAADELPSLQPEVQREPALALDGGGDGLVFYRAMAKNWLALLRPGGVLAVEIGDTQAGAVCGIFRAAGMDRLSVYKDLAGLDRAVLCTKP